MTPKILALIVVLFLIGCESHHRGELPTPTPGVTPTATSSVSPTPQFQAVTEPHAQMKFWADIATVIIALCAVFVTLWEAYNTRHHNKLTVKPNLRFGRYHQSETPVDSVEARPAGLYILNAGFGPAIIESTAVHSKSRNKSSKSILEIVGWIKDAGFTANQTTCLFYTKGDVVSAGKFSRYLILKLEANSEIDQFNKLLDDLDIVLSYRSMYEESFTCSSREHTDVNA